MFNIGFTYSNHKSHDFVPDFVVGEPQAVRC